MNYLNNTWVPQSHDIIKDDDLRLLIDDRGFETINGLDEELLSNLQNLFDESHDISDDRGGVFYSVYSKDIEYRRKIHNRICELLDPLLNNYFSDFRLVLGSFVIKYPGPQSEFALHQDGTGLDELRHSPLNLWIPLQDVNKDNGALAILPYSQHFFSPYRHISFPTPFEKIQSTVRSYLQIKEMKRGEALVFDNRLLHNSVTNISDHPRIAVVCGLLPKEADLITCHKKDYEYYGEVELIQHEDDFLLEHPNFLIDCHIRPNTGKSLGFVKDPYGPINENDFIALCNKYGLEKTNQIAKELDVERNLIGEPDHSFH